MLVNPSCCCSGWSSVAGRTTFTAREPAFSRCHRDGTTPRERSRAWRGIDQTGGRVLPGTPARLRALRHWMRKPVSETSCRSSTRSAIAFAGSGLRREPLSDRRTAAGVVPAQFASCSRVGTTGAALACSSATRSLQRSRSSFLRRVSTWPGSSSCSAGGTLITTWGSQQYTPCVWRSVPPSPPLLGRDWSTGSAGYPPLRVGASADISGFLVGFAFLGAPPLGGGLSRDQRSAAGLKGRRAFSALLKFVIERFGQAVLPTENCDRHRVECFVGRRSWLWASSDTQLLPRRIMLQ